MIIIHLLNGKNEIIDETDSQKIKQLIQDNMGNDVGILIQSLIDKADTEQQKFDSDYNSYEALLESWCTAGNDILDLCKKIDTYLREKKRIDRYKMIELIEEIQQIINNEM